MKEIILSLLAGLMVGALFRFIKLPIPAPPVFSAVVGVFGIYTGAKIVDVILHLLGK